MTADLYSPTRVNSVARVADILIRDGLLNFTQRVLRRQDVIQMREQLQSAHAQQFRQELEEERRQEQGNLEFQLFFF